MQQSWYSIAIAVASGAGGAGIVAIVLYIISRGQLKSFTFGRFTAQFTETDAAAAGALALEITRETNRVFMLSSEHKREARKQVEKALRYHRNAMSAGFKTFFDSKGYDYHRLYRSVVFRLLQEMLKNQQYMVKGAMMRNFEENNFDDLAGHASEERYIDAAITEIHNILEGYLDEIFEIPENKVVSQNELRQLYKDHRQTVSSIFGAAYREIIEQSIARKSELVQIVERLLGKLHDFGIKGHLYESLESTLREQLIHTARRGR